MLIKLSLIKLILIMAASFAIATPCFVKEIGNVKPCQQKYVDTPNTIQRQHVMNGLHFKSAKERARFMRAISKGYNPNATW
jgi:hypothetical protein